MGEERTFEELMDLTIALANERHVESLMTRVIEAALRITHAEGAAIFTLDRLAKYLHRVSYNYRGQVETVASETRVALYGNNLAPNLREPAAFAASTSAVVNLGDIDKTQGYDFASIRQTDLALGFKTRSLVIVPLTIQSRQTIGVLQLVNVRDHATDRVGALAEPLLRPLKSLAAHAAVAIWNTRLLEENQRLIRQLGQQNDELQQENTRLMSRVGSKSFVRPKELVGDSPPIERAYDLIARAAGSQVPILLRGETGTGKEMMANFIHQSSDRVGKPFIAQNCATLPETLLETELFGHVKGAFTGAGHNKAGLVHEAHHGTLFLDEIGDMPLSLQAKVLRLLQEGEVRRVGATRAETVDVRIVAATNVNLEEKIERGEFRKDLFYRINVFPIVVPPLRERPSDIPKLVDHFLKTAAASIGRTPPMMTREALEALMRWSYPGNVRELKNILERALLLADQGQPITRRHLPVEITGFDEKRPLMPTTIPDGDLKSIVGQYEAMVIEAKLRAAGWNQSRVARDLNISRRTIVEKLARYDIRRR
jgi:sigma-54-dependent transcriptional regulator